LNLPPRTLAEITNEMLVAKQADGIGPLYRRQLRLLLERACKTLSQPIADITTQAIDDYLRGLAVSSRSRYNARAVLVSAFEFAKQRGYLPRDRETAAMLSAQVRVKSGEVEIFTPKEMAALLAAADAEALPLIALGGFAGLRTAEIGRLDWKDMNFPEGIITVSAAKSKTASRRIVPIQPNLTQWLAPWAKAAGPVFQPRDPSKIEKRVAEAAKVTWKHNALRHSFGSYRLAQIKNAAEVALEMGNSPQMIFKHYRELVTPKDATAWWSIEPKRPANVITITAGGRASAGK
jgi:integrase